MQALYAATASAGLVLAPATPGDCFFIAYERSASPSVHGARDRAERRIPRQRIGALAHPDPNTLPPIEVHFRTDPDGFLPYSGTLPRSPALGPPGDAGARAPDRWHREARRTGDISYDPDNHDHMVRTRAEKVRRVAQEIPPTSINGPATGDLLVVGWGGTTAPSPPPSSAPQATARRLRRSTSGT